MDKNMVNIDDLVRQRLLGGEEKERAGAWLRMSELLEEEMPRRRGAFMWRRTFGALGVMALLGAIALGGYELNSYRNLHNNATDGTSIAVSAPAPTANGLSTNNTIADNTNNTDNTANSNNTTTNTTEHSTAIGHTDNKTNNNEPNNSTNNKQANRIIAVNSSISRDNNYTGKKATDANNAVKQTTAHTAVNSTAAVANTVVGSNAVAGSSNEVAQPGRIAAANEVATAANTTTGNTTPGSTDIATAGNSHAKKSGDVGSSHVKAANTTADKHVATDRHTTTGTQTASGKTHSSTVTENKVAKNDKASIPGSDATKSSDIPANKADEANEAGNIVAATDKIAATETTGNKTAEEKAATTGNKKAGTGHATTITPTATAKRTGAVAGKPATASSTATTKNGTAATGVATVKKNVPKVDNDHKEALAKTPSTDKTKTEGTGAEDNEDNATAQAGNNRTGNTTTKPGSSKAAKHGNDLAIVGSSAPGGNTAVPAKKTIAAKIAAKEVPGQNKIAATQKKAAPIAKTPATTSGGTKGTTIGHKNNSVNPGAVASAAGNTRMVSPTAFNNRIPAASKTAKTGSKEAGDNIGEVSLVNSRKHKKVIEKIVLLHRYMSNTPKEGNMHLDTISIESITEEFEMASAQKADALRNGNEVPTSEDPDADTSPLKPSSSSESYAMKEPANKQTKGSKTIENLNAAFNDIKYNAGNATFAAGISAGINSTFFGPNNFKGFQFGLNGTLTFSQSLSLMAEIKYFHRINDNFTLNDNYYQYTAQPNGGYKREFVSNPYSISTLHSIEMPIALRFTAGKFNFAVGPNVVYTFGINTGNYRTVDPNATFVTTMGNDNTAKIQAGDFNSRFGLGYLFGVSYQVSPKVTIDLRDVQTIWDNASTTGAKAVSTQLFRSPSFQLSLGYKFGGGKKDQDR